VVNGELQRTDLLVTWERALIRPVGGVQVFERRDDQSQGSFPQLSHGLRTAPDCGPEIRADGKIDVEHHDKVGPGKEPRDVPPRVELPVKGIDDEMHVDEAGHAGRGGVQRVERA